MRAYRAHLRATDRLVYRLALGEAKRLRSLAIGPPEIVLAIVHPDAGDSPAARALTACGLSRDVLERLAPHHRSGDETADQSAGEPAPQLNPAALHLYYLAQGIAAGQGAAAVGPEHLLLAFIWDPSFSAWQLQLLGTTRERLRDELARQGATLPQTDLPARDPRRYGPRVEVSMDQARALTRHLWHVLPAGASFIWNRAGEGGVIAVSEGLDPDEYVRRALERHDRLTAEASGSSC